jgi:predicted DNA-binding protein with PD1-like motif
VAVEDSVVAEDLAVAGLGAGEFIPSAVTNPLPGVNTKMHHLVGLWPMKNKEQGEQITMQYTQGRWGRVFVVRIDHGEDLLLSLGQFVMEQKISHGLIHLLGALRDGRMVTGPRHLVLPPEPHYETFDGGFEIFGTATIYPSEQGPRIHVHATVGRGADAMTGCLRERAMTYIIVEAVIMEIKGLSAAMRHDARTGLSLPFLGKEP